MKNGTNWKRLEIGDIVYCEGESDIFYVVMAVHYAQYYIEPIDSKAGLPLRGVSFYKGDYPIRKIC